ncbi:MAG TPA: cbb3-type cytochrome c oxidase subunit II [Candidatus Angelobacter sp.]|nr:cbb3-type cytochrome c oxidase subunit II [Candidatus Angelobacter sp.]
MNHGPLIFLGAFFALALSWFGLVFEPQLQLGNAQPATNMVNIARLYPQMRPGEARQGLEVYRSLGCATCHSQQIGQTGRTYGVVLTGAGTNRNEVAAALISLKAAAATGDAQKFFTELPQTVLKDVTRAAADAALAKLEPTGAKAELKIIPTGPDIARGWGKRRSVAEDFLYDQPVMLGSQRIGPDLADVGSRLPIAQWHLLHLYNPRVVEHNSVMPPYRFLFEKRKIGREPAADALKLAGEFAPEPGYEIVPTDQAKQLVAYLLSLRADTAIFETPMYVAVATSTNAPGALTNTPAAAATNSVAK